MTTTATVTDITAGRRFRSVELAKRAERDTWALADAVHEDVNAELEKEGKPSFGVGQSSGLRAAEDVVDAAHRDAGTDVKRSYLHNLYVTARAWPSDDRRPALATFDAHFELRGSNYRNRVATLERIAAKSKTGRASRDAVKLWKSERKPHTHRTFLELVDRRVRASLKAAAKPWHTVAESDREAIAQLLHRIAAEVEAGTFPKATP